MGRKSRKLSEGYSIVSRGKKLRELEEYETEEEMRQYLEAAVPLQDETDEQEKVDDLPTDRPRCDKVINDKLGRIGEYWQTDQGEAG